MTKKLPVSRVINVISEESQLLWTIDESEGQRGLLASDMGEILDGDGSFDLMALEGSVSG